MKKLKDPNKIKNRGLFDHVKHIRQIRSENYYESLNDTEKKSFNHYMILKTLSMDQNVVECISYLYKYIDKIPSPQFYKLLLECIPKSTKFYPWFKSDKIRYNDELLKIISNKFEVSTRQANEYVGIMVKSDKGIMDIVNICKDYGLEDKEVEKLTEFTKEIDNE